MKKKPRKRSTIKKRLALIDRAAASLEKAGIRQDGRAVVHLGGVPTHRWQQPEKQTSVQK